MAGLALQVHRPLTAQQGPDYTLSFDCAARFELADSGFWSHHSTCRLSGSFGDLSIVTGWSISLTADSGTITSITTEGTAGADASADPAGFRQGGFERSELTTLGEPGTDCERRRGATSVVVLGSVQQPATLAAADEHDIAHITVHGLDRQATDCPAVRLRYLEGCQDSVGTVRNVVSTLTGSLRPGIVDCEPCFPLQVEGLPCPTPSEGLQVIWQDRNVRTTPELFAAQIPTPSPDQPAQIRRSVRPGQTGEAELWVGLVSQIEERAGSTIEVEGDIFPTAGVQGYSLSIAAAGRLLLTDLLLDGTTSAEHPDGLRVNGFEVIEFVDPQSQGQGLVAAVVQSFLHAITLPPVGTATLFGIRLEADRPQEDHLLTGTVHFLDGLRGGGGPVSNVATIDGATEEFACLQPVHIRFLVATGTDFLRCDANDDGRSDIADAVHIVSVLFRDSDPAVCPPASDCNGDLSIDLGDALYALRYQLLGGEPPPAPYPECGGADLLTDTLAQECSGLFGCR